MKDKERLNLIKDFAKIYGSLIDSADKAGGGGFTVDWLDKMTALELLITLAPNRISFKYTKDQKGDFDQETEDYDKTDTDSEEE